MRRVALLLGLLSVAGCARSHDPAGEDDATEGSEAVDPSELVDEDEAADTAPHDRGELPASEESGAADGGGPGWLPVRCETSAANASVEGHTPLGELNLRYAFMGDPFWNGMCELETHLAFSSVPIFPGQELALQLTRVFSLDVREAPMPLEVDVALTRGDERLEAEGTLSLDPDWADRYSGSLSIVADGWNVTGTFRAAPCALLNDYCE